MAAVHWHGRRRPAGRLRRSCGGGVYHAEGLEGTVKRGRAVLRAAGAGKRSFSRILGMGANEGVELAPKEVVCGWWRWSKTVKCPDEVLRTQSSCR
jgi:hypothetical protein